MFMVFSSGTLEREIILVGMGIALLSTFLGLIVSIILNFCSTLTEGYFSKHLENVTTKADELRFRLIELSESSSFNGVSEKAEKY
jgi:biopolymer transport protein ExbB/TolQ